MCAALNAGFTAEDIERIQSEMPQVCEKYGELRADNCADFAMLRDLREASVDVADIEDEL